MSSANDPGGRAAPLLGGFVAVSLVFGMLLAGLALPAAVAAGSATTGGARFFNSLPAQMTQPPLSEQSTVLDNQGRPIAHFYDEKRILVTFDQIAPIMRTAIVSIEDSRFYEHGGVDLKGLLRAFVNNQVNDGHVQGASTLTQQLTKLEALEAATAKNDKQGQVAALAQNYARKVQEIRLAIALEHRKSKDQILTDYLNIANFGDSTYGIEAAAQYFFGGTSAKQLTLPQAALLAGMVQAPTAYNPFRNPGKALTRRNVVLARMLELKAISETDYATAKAAPLGVKKKEAYNGCVEAKINAYFCSTVQEMIAKDDRFSSLGATSEERVHTLKRGGLVIRTTLDGDLQEAAQEAIVDRVPVGDPSKANAAAITVEPGTGKVLAMAQNTSYFPGAAAGQSTLNYSVDSRLGSSNGFQPGSTMKAITLAAWLDKGKGLYDFVDASRKTRSYSEFATCAGRPGGGTFKVDNSEGDEGGTLSVVNATADSVNTAFMEMESQIGICPVKQMADKLGLHLAHPYNPGCDAKGTDPTTHVPDCLPTLTLGVLDISPMTMASAYATFAADGTYCTPVVVTSISDRSGKDLSVPGGECTQAISTNVARGVTYALKGVLTDGTARGNNIAWPAAGKTGTTDDSKDTWFVGYTKQRATAVWVGDPNTYPGVGRKSLNFRTIGDRHYGHVFGATIAAPIWRSVMTSAQQGLPHQDWDRPTGKVMEGSSVKVPSVVGKSLADAQATLEGKGFKVVVGAAVHSSIPDGIVAKTVPGPGARTAPGSTITLSPGDGSIAVVDPNAPPSPGLPGVPGPGLPPPAGGNGGLGPIPGLPLPGLGRGPFAGGRPAGQQQQ